jgi:predicted HAD superfamily hydrolase
MLKELIDYLIIRKSGCFDAAYYLLSYPDCRLADVDPLWHFVRYGWRERRNPSSDFDTEYYLKTNPDVQQSGLNPLVHYLKYGQEEGRSPHPSSRVSFLSPRLSHRGKRSDFQRAIYHLGNKVYRLVPPQYRPGLLRWLYSHFDFLFKIMLGYRAWEKSHLQMDVLYQHNNLLDLQEVKPAEEVHGRIAIHLHVFYHDVVKELAEYLRNMPFPYDLYVSVSNEGAWEVCGRTFTNLPLCRKVEIRKVPNRGRNIAPLFCTFGEILSQYDYIAHLHTKKSLYNQGATEGWREYLYRNLLGNAEQIRRIFGLMQGNEPRGIVYPQNYVLLPYWANTWLANEELGRVWCAHLGITEVPRGYFDYPASSMFWARTDALKPLFDASITINDFPEEAGQTDGTLAHTIERLFGLCSLRQGMRPAIIKDSVNPSWSPWRFDQYVNRPYISLVEALNSSRIKLIVFDVFDTLLCRPLLNAETVKKVVVRRVGRERGIIYQQYRALAEEQARRLKGYDVGLNDIYAQMGQLTGLDEDCLRNLQRIEQEVENALLEPRWEALQLYREALTTGKPIVLMTDMFLPREQIAECLQKYGITAWDDLFVSNELGLRKDDGKLYEYVLKKYAIKPNALLMVGDNERSDVQIPCDMGATFIHLLKPVELARGLPRFSQLITAHEREDDVDAEITLGLVVRKNFSPIHYPFFDPAALVQVTPYIIGYSLVGPLLVSFANWLIQQTRADGISRLYFLSREGKLMKEIYDCWSQGLTGVPLSDYLVISRRAAAVAAISTFDDILDIAKTIYFSNTIDNFLYTRYGLTLSDEHWKEVAQCTGWSRVSKVSVQNKQVDHLIPLLRTLEADILKKVQVERPALLRYLSAKGLDRDDHQAVVDVGYAGSIQDYLNRLLPRQVHGYYLMTELRSSKVSETHNVILRGCFYENIVPLSHAPIMHRYSFDLEKLLSSLEPQIEYYELDSAGNIKGHFRELHPSERDIADIKQEIRRGALDYAEDARRIRESVLPDFQPSSWTARMLIEAFLAHKSRQESTFLSKIVLDDYYCGRDLVL